MLNFLFYSPFSCLEWTSDRPNSPKQLKFVHRGKFLENTQTFEQNKIPSQEVTVVHLLVMNTDSNDASGEKLKSITEPSSKCCCIVM
ncbi:hypothetical protein HMI54_012814 [Coelomomyces lativittatus]|nr:hypothetical protein HMI54_012814 [Coelomomyces lativittatus]